MFTNDNIYEQYYNKSFTGRDIQDMMHDISETLIEMYFTKSIVSNEIYERDIFKVIKKIIIKILSFSNKDEEFNKNLALYIFKKHFKDIFSLFSEYVMREVAYSNENVIEFLKYYSLDTLVIDEKRYIVPQIREKEFSQRWNVTSMFAILKTYVKTLHEIDEIEQELGSLREKELSFHKDEMNPNEYNKKIERRFKNIESSIEYNEQRISIIRDTLKISKDEDEIQRAQEELKECEEQRATLRDQKKEIIKMKIKQVQLYAYEQIVKEIETIQRNTKALYKIIEQNKDAYLSIKNALSQALVSKKQPL